MAYDKIKASPMSRRAPMTLQHELGTLEQQRRLRGVFLGRKLVQPLECFYCLDKDEQPFENDWSAPRACHPF
jgi:hypothetical protein